MWDYLDKRVKFISHFNLFDKTDVLLAGKAKGNHL